ncbi:MAG: YjbQ family protein, partial [Spirochaetales bacterium]|nr:YjbQ family protein [Spirochaetales bacterium]
SVIIPIIDGEVQLGEFGCVYFADWDQVRGRTRTIIVQVQGE